MSEQNRSSRGARNIVKRVIALIAILSGLVVSSLAYLIWQNNRIVEQPSAQSISDALENGIRWLASNRTLILSQNNPMLWRFVKESADITNDERLHALFIEYKKRHLDPYPRNVWRYLFDAGAGAPVLVRELKEYPDYNLYFIFGATCDPTLGREDIIQRQNKHEFCEDQHPFAPACVTHQLMGARLALQRGCLESDVARNLVSALQDKIVTQLTWDPRVVDVYLQRVLMLAESGAVDRIKPVWLQRVLDAQLPDGGWDNFHPLFPVSPGRYLGMMHMPVVRERKSNFHTTVQGIYLMSLWRAGQHSFATAGYRLQ